MKNQLSDRAQSIKPSPTIAVTTRAAELRAEGKDIIGLGAGEPDFDTPDHIKEAAIKAIENGFTKYTAVDGTPELKAAIQKKFSVENQLDYDSSQILVSSGAKHSLYNIMQAMLNPGDNIIVPAPYWVSYPDMALLAGASTTLIKTDVSSGFKISPAQLEAAISDNTRLFIMNSPSNPSGACYSEEELKALGEVLLKYPQVTIVTDDIYEHILWGQDKFCNIVNACPDLYDKTIVVNGVSKAYSMTGWRIGYLAGPDHLIKAMKKIQSQSTSNPTSISQVAAVAALEGDQTYIKESCGIFKERHDFVNEKLNSVEGINCLTSDGTFYAFPDMNGLIEKLDGVTNDLELAEFFIEKAGVAMVPGSAFGADGCMRISFATSMENLEKSMQRIIAVV